MLCFFLEQNLVFSPGVEGCLCPLKGSQQFNRVVSSNGSTTLKFMSGGNQEIDMAHRHDVCSDCSVPVL